MKDKLLDDMIRCVARLLMFQPDEPETSVLSDIMQRIDELKQLYKTEEIRRKIPERW